MSNNFINHNEWNPTKIGYTKCKLNTGGKGRSGLVNNGRGKPIDIVMPADMLTWGAEQARDNDGNPLDKYSLSIQFPNDEYPNEEHSAFLEKIKQFEAQMMEDSIQNYQEWFPNVKLRSKEEAAMHARLNFMSALKYKKDASGMPDTTKAPTMKIKLPSWDGTWKFSVYNKNTHEQIFPPSMDSSDQLSVEEAIPKMSRITAFVRCGGRWFVNATWGYKWNLITAVVNPSDYSTEDINPFNTIDFGPVSASSAVGDSKGKEASVTAAVVEEDDGITPECVAECVDNAKEMPEEPAPHVDEEEEDEPEPEPEPAPKKKKVIVKKK